MSTARNNDILSRIDDDLAGLERELVRVPSELTIDDTECIEWQDEVSGEIVRADEQPAAIGLRRNASGYVIVATAPEAYHYGTPMIDEADGEFVYIPASEVVALAEAEPVTDLREAAAVEYPELRAEEVTEPAEAEATEPTEPEPPTVIERLIAIGVPAADAPGLAEDPLRNDPYYGAVMVDLEDEADIELWLSQISADIKAGRLVFANSAAPEEDEAAIRRAIIDDQMNTSQAIQGVANWTAEARRAQQEALFADAALEYAAKIRAYLASYLVFPAAYRDAQLDVMTAWLIHTYAFKAVGVTPYLAVTAPTQGSGKTTVLEILSTLANNPSKVEVNPTAPVVRLMAEEGRTLFLDEIDMLVTDKTFVGVLNSGYKAGGSVTRVARIKNAGQVADSSSTFCPKAIAGIAREGKLPLPTATLDRCIEIKIIRAKPGEISKRFRVDVMRDEPEVMAMRDWMQHWTNKMRGQLRDAYFEVPRLSSSRAMQLFESLITVAGLLGGDWYERLCAAAVLMDGARDQNLDPNAALVEDLQTVLDAYREDVKASHIRVSDLVGLRNVLAGRKLSDKLTEESMVARLGAFGIQAERITKDGETFLTYALTDGENLLPQWVDLFDRYAG